jgi:hypothetical protein
VNDLKININHVNNNGNGNNGFILACIHNENDNIIKYLLTIEIVIKQMMSHYLDYEYVKHNQKHNKIN